MVPLHCSVLCCVFAFSERFLSSLRCFLFPLCWTEKSWAIAAESYKEIRLCKECRGKNTMFSRGKSTIFRAKTHSGGKAPVYFGRKNTHLREKHFGHATSLVRPHLLLPACNLPACNYPYITCIYPLVKPQ